MRVEVRVVRYIPLNFHILSSNSTMADDEKSVAVKAPAEAPAAECTEKKFSGDELAKHNSEESCWMALEGTVFDLTKVETYR